MLHDPEDYPDPETFKPERYIKNGKIDSSVRDPLAIAFGFGRRYVHTRQSFLYSVANQHLFRACPGRYLAHDSLIMTIASVLHTFNIYPVLNENGEKFDPFSSVVTGMVSYVSILNYRTYYS